MINEKNMNFSAITRRIRRCESETAAQLVLEHAIKEAVSADRRDRIYASIKEEDDHCADGDCMVDSNYACQGRRRKDNDNASR